MKTGEKMMGKKRSYKKKQRATDAAEEHFDTYRNYRIGAMCVGTLLIAAGAGLTLFGNIPGAAETASENPVSAYKKFCTFAPFVSVGIVLVVRSLFNPLDIIVALLTLLGGFSMGIAVCDTIALINEEPGNVLNRFVVDWGISGLALFFAFKDAKSAGKLAKKS